jgi:mycothiol system anti-sigma-R factor
MLCDQVKRAVYYFLDGTLAQKHLHDFSEHVSVCPECGMRMTVTRRLRAFVIRRLPRESAPGRLKQRLARTLRAFTADL